MLRQSCLILRFAPFFCFLFHKFGLLTSIITVSKKHIHRHYGKEGMVAFH